MHVVQIFVAAAAFCVRAAEFPERKAYLATYQDAWKSFFQTSVFVLYQRSFAEDPLVAFDGRCFHGRAYQWNLYEKYAVSEAYYWDDVRGLMTNWTAYLAPMATEGYIAQNTIAVSLVKDSPYTVRYPIVVSEYDNCDILRVPHRANGCELWVTVDRVQEVSSLCLFIYDLLCGTEKFVKYDTEFCTNKIQIKH
ncbi:uncharacterized protein LOC144168404 [Haemaphysalis longicornis]